MHLDSFDQTDVIYLDFSKAFDSVSHRLLCHKLQAFGISGTLLAWVRSYLHNRCQRVVLDGAKSDWLPVTSSVPQGSILGPLLFLLYTNDIGATLSLYADDAKVYRPIHNRFDCRSLQSDLRRLEQWSLIWKLTFNTAKCKTLSFSRRENITFSYRCTILFWSLPPHLMTSAYMFAIYLPGNNIFTILLLKLTICWA